MWVIFLVWDFLIFYKTNIVYDNANQLWQFYFLYFCLLLRELFRLSYEIERQHKKNNSKWFSPRFHLKLFVFNFIHKKRRSRMKRKEEKKKSSNEVCAGYNRIFVGEKHILYETYKCICLPSRKYRLNSSAENI